MTRIIAGEFGGRRIAVPRGRVTRPTTDRVREALFSILEELNCQVFMTGTEPALFSSLKGKAQFLTVDHGRVFPTTDA